jgi:hypothetical protein
MQYSELPYSDQHAICDTLRLPKPHHEITLDVIILQEKLTPADVLDRLDRSRTLRAQIAAAVLRGRVTRCDPDPALHPKPYPKPRPAPALAESAPIQAPNLKSRPAPKRLASFVPNPKRPGSESRDRYELYEIGLTEIELLAKGMSRSDFRNDTAKRFITWTT